MAPLDSTISSDHDEAIDDIGYESDYDAVRHFCHIPHILDALTLLIQTLDYREVVRTFVTKLHDMAGTLQRQLDTQALESVWFKSIATSRLVVKGGGMMDEYLTSV